MLPGFRFLFAAIVLSMSVLVFGLGAAALLRAAHEQFASMPARRAPPEPVFSRSNDPPPTLSLLRVEPEIAEKVPGNVARSVILEAVAPALEALDDVPVAAPEKLAALKIEEPVATEPTKVETPAVEAMPAVQAAPTEAPTPGEEVKLAAITETPPSAVASPPTEPVVEAPSFANNPAAKRIATLGGPAVSIEEAVTVKTTSAKPKKSRSVNRKRAQRTKERERRRIAAARRAQLARQVAAQQQADPFAPTGLRTR